MADKNGYTAEYRVCPEYRIFGYCFTHSKLFYAKIHLYYNFAQIHILVSEINNCKQKQICVFSISKFLALVLEELTA